MAKLERFSNAARWRIIALLCLIVWESIFKRLLQTNFRDGKILLFYEFFKGIHLAAKVVSKRFTKNLNKKTFDKSNSPTKAKPAFRNQISGLTQGERNFDKGEPIKRGK